MFNEYDPLTSQVPPAFGPTALQRPRGVSSVPPTPMVAPTLRLPAWGRHPVRAVGVSVRFVARMWLLAKARLAPTVELQKLATVQPVTDGVGTMYAVSVHGNVRSPRLSDT